MRPTPGEGLIQLGRAAFSSSAAPRDRHRARVAIAASVVAMIALVLVFEASRRSFALDLRIYRDAVVSTFRDHKPLYTTRHEPVQLPFTYPPFALLWLSPLALLPVGVGALAVVLAGLLCCIAVCDALVRVAPMSEGTRGQVLGVCLAAVLTDPFLLTMGYGQVNFALFLLVFADLFWLPRRWRGIGIGIASAIKLTPLVFLLFLIWRREWRAAAVAVATAIACTCVAALVIPGALSGYLQSIKVYSANIGSPAYVSNQSINGIIARAVPGQPPSTIAWAVGCIVVLSLCAAALRRLLRDDAGDQLAAFACVSVAGLLVSPISWSHHWVVIVLIGGIAVLTPNRPVRWAAAGLWLAEVTHIIWLVDRPDGVIAYGVVGRYLVSNAVSLCAVWFLAACALRLGKHDDARALPAGDREHQ